MKKTTTRSKPATKSRATTKRAAPAKSKVKVVAKTTQRKGVRHHAKHLYHATPKFIHGMIVGGIVGVLVVGFLGGSAFHPDSASASVLGFGSTCKVKTDADHTFKITGSSVTATFTVTDDCSSQAVSLVTWTAPNPNKGKPYNQQNLFSHTTGTFRPGVHTLTTSLPNCYYQIDLITGSNPTDSTGGPGYSKENRLRRSLHGGTQACDSVTLPTIPTAPPLPPTTTVVTEAAQTSTLPDTGPAALFVVLGLAVVGGYVFHMTHHHVKKRRHARPTTHHAAR